MPCMATLRSWQHSKPAAAHSSASTCSKVAPQLNVAHLHSRCPARPVQSLVSRVHDALPSEFLRAWVRGLWLLRIWSRAVSSHRATPIGATNTCQALCRNDC